MVAGSKRVLAPSLWSATALGLAVAFAAPVAGAGEPRSLDRLSGAPEAELAGDFNVNLEAAEWNDGSDFWRFSEGGASQGLSYFTPRLGALQLGPSYLPTAGQMAQESDPAGPDADDRGFALRVNLSESFGDINVGLGGDFSRGQSQGLQYDPALGRPPDSELRHYGVNLNLGYGSFSVTGAYAREVSSNLVEGDIWDAGIAYGTGAWTFGVNYLYSQFEANSSAYQTEDEVRAISGEVSYSIGPGFYARAQLSHAQWEDSSGTLDRGTVGILGLRYNF